MACSREDIKRWIVAGKYQGATHLIVVCDTFDHDDYPVYVTPDEDVRKIESKYRSKPMQNVMEVYFLMGDIKAQLDEHRAFNYG